MPNVVVVLEDDLDLAALVSELLQVSGYEVIHVTDTDSLLCESALRSPCIALVDGLSPTAFNLWWIGPKLAALGIPPVAFTAHAAAIAEFEADSHGFVGVVTKPFDADEFLHLVCSICWDDHHTAVS